MSKTRKIIFMLLIVILAISSYFFVKELVENKKENDVYKELQEIIKIEDNIDTSNMIKATFSSENDDSYNLESISKINDKVIAWIKIDGTNINYPVMQNEDYYLHRDIYKNYSNHGTPYLAYNCNLEKSSNLIIYSHNMSDNTMFSQLEKYKSYDFYSNHKYIKLYTLDDGKTVENIYEVMYAFKTVAYSDTGYRYYDYVDFQNFEEYQEFANNCEELAFYKTNITGTYKDKFITLSTCEYSQKNGRMVVVAKKIS